jgi:hypothetical protein
MKREKTRRESMTAAKSSAKAETTNKRHEIMTKPWPKLVINVQIKKNDDQHKNRGR